MESVGRDGMGERLPYRFGLSAHFYQALAAVLVIAVIAFGAMLYFRVTAPPEEDTYIPRPVQLTAEATLLQRYVRIDTSNPPGREMEAARLLIAELERGGVKAELIESAPGRANVYARIRGQRPNEGLLLLHHIDVAPADEKGWQQPPFSAEVYLNQIWGRGTLDMKGIGICQLSAFLKVARSGVRPKRDLVYLAVADEERGGEFGTAWLLKNRRDIFEGIRYAINEGGFTEMRAETLTYFGVETGTKQFVTLRVRSQSREVLQEARIALEPYIMPFDPERILPEVRSFFRAIAPHRIYGRPILEDVDAAINRGEFWMLQDTFRALTQNLIIPLGIEKNSGSYSMDVVLANLPDEDPERMIARAESLIRQYPVAIDVVEKMGPTRISKTDTPFFQLIVETVRKFFGPDAPVGPQILANYANDSRYLRSLGIDCYGFWPFLVDFYQTLGVHAVDERVRVDWFNTGVQVTQELVSSYCYR